MLANCLAATSRGGAAAGLEWRTLPRLPHSRIPILLEASLETVIRPGAADRDPALIGKDQSKRPKTHDNLPGALENKCFRVHLLAKDSAARRAVERTFDESARRPQLLFAHGYRRRSRPPGAYSLSPRRNDPLERIPLWHNEATKHLSPPARSMLRPRFPACGL